MQQLTDNSPMPFGKYKGEPMANVPDPYLKWLRKQLRMLQDKGTVLSDHQQQVVDYVDDFGEENLKER
jgi:hypothetical protein